MRSRSVTTIRDLWRKDPTSSVHLPPELDGWKNTSTEATNFAKESSARQPPKYARVGAGLVELRGIDRTSLTAPVRRWGVFMPEGSGVKRGVDGWDGVAG